MHSDFNRPQTEQTASIAVSGLYPDFKRRFPSIPKHPHAFYRRTRGNPLVRIKVDMSH